MLSRIIALSIKNKPLIILFMVFLVCFGLFSLTRITIGAVPDVTNNQVQVITTSRNLSTEDMEKFITYPVELEMANLPGVVEIRSISKFGLSVVTIVFEDRMGAYLPRQLIAEKIQAASEKIPQGYGIPKMGPLTTGLGEIYQYILDVEPGYEELYSATDLRTIQDWIVKRQLSGIPGVVEVNTWGGYLKQYEVAIKTEKLNAMNITAQEVFKALETNNSLAGAGYIEKVNQAYFIRGEGLAEALEDIESIVVRNVNGIPVLIRDVAEVGYGHATRFGAITGNGEGEKVLGQVMMLKDANSKEVIESVKKRVASIAESLPEGVVINAFLDRSKLIRKTTLTVTENLVLGCLIVIFVVVLLLGNLRSGLVVASVIPLSLLFALSMMYIFEVDANLMSLGAIDFGIIIDGAVIIVEFTAFQIGARRKELGPLSKKALQAEKDKITFSSTSKMMNSAIFGQLIILIVFIPILSLSGVEGKMFKPMALTFSFALIGAMILCFTYVPVAASLLLKPGKKEKKTITDSLLKGLNNAYDPVINLAMKRKKWVIGTAVLLLVFALFLFSRIGGEFVPTLDEGDFVIQPVLKTGTSLKRTIETTTRIEKILLDNFPEVQQVVTRIGAAEVPTDPMSMEESDVIIILKPKKDWVSARSKDELAARLKDALAVIPGMEVEFTQPIEMRFNELITGVRADVAVKIFGEDLDLLSKKGNEVKALIEKVDGVADISVEKIVGLPEMRVAYDRRKIALYGLNIKELNDLISMGFAGRTVGSIYEGERLFDLVVRLDRSNRTDIANLKSLYVDLPRGGKVPLSELADISYQKGAAKIARDDTRRRIVVGINVRDRDLQSVVEDVQGLIETGLQLPPGYHITYGGQFENLKSARSRLVIAIPLALLLIFVLLFFAFHSIKDVLIIYSAIPLAAVGGVFLLWLRGLPFSISAGVGFIALFGIAVLNGIVLIEHFKEMKKEDFETVEALIKKGTKDRLRAVLLTATAAALGFLPMALSTNVGAEVQRPLATVVIGGLVTATLLTLVVLPVLYSIFTSGRSALSQAVKNSNKKLPLGLFLLLAPWITNAQDHALNLQELINIAVENNAGLKAEELRLEESKALIPSAFSFDKTQVYYNYDENNLTIDEEILNVFGLQQDFLFPTVYWARKKLNKADYNLAAKAYEIEKKVLERALTAAYYKYLYTLEKVSLLRHLDSLYGNFSAKAQRRFELGETNYLEKITATASQKRIRIQLQQMERNAELALNGLLKKIQAEDTLAVAVIPLEKIPLRLVEVEQSVEMEFYRQKVNLFQTRRTYEKQRLLPDLSLDYFQGTAPGIDGHLKGYQLGLKIPVLLGGQTSKIKASRLAEEAAISESKDYEIRLNARYEELKAKLSSHEEILAYYEGEGGALSDEILKTAALGFSSGEIDFFQYLKSIENAYEIKLDYLENLHQYNQTAIELNYLTL